MGIAGIVYIVCGARGVETADRHRRPLDGDTLMKSSYRDVQPFVTKDGSEIRELMHPAVHGNRAQSLAEATVVPGQRTALHRHRATEEIYHFTAGAGVMTLGDERFAVAAGDTVCIPPGTPHCVESTGSSPLTILCACAPAYAHGDTELVEAGGAA
jgi:mannose-6-phosphate isomerase-like protein (cupin superfamily)